MPNLTLGPPIIKALRKHSTAFFDCHCMIQEPYKWVDDFAKAGANSMTFHYEADVGEEGFEYLAKKIRDSGMRAGLSIKPKTEIDEKIIFLLE